MLKSILFSILIVISIQGETKEIIKSEEFYTFGLHELNKLLAEAPLSLIFYTPKSEQIHLIPLLNERGKFYKEINFNNLGSIRSYVFQDNSGIVKYKPRQ
ncbi:hypothetical protein [Endozoicomonas euniceicola]|uniref:Uncharacterized protein n=1 Tax=Endozoicomonas euniceicola TaxID=1234143 RepID=A0ABY6GW18_9GAMM|nr:hypothetical protein [Endozoicomonas euniceicola]UYM16962.1 hypothetical protein NX720_03290 [Endozoicomonas euniceicola]